MAEDRRNSQSNSQDRVKARPAGQKRPNRSTYSKRNISKTSGKSESGNAQAQTRNSNNNNK